MKISNLFESNDVIDIGNYVATGEEFPGMQAVIDSRLYLFVGTKFVNDPPDCAKWASNKNSGNATAIGVIFLPLVKYLTLPKHAMDGVSKYYFENNEMTEQIPLNFTSYIEAAKVYGGMLYDARMADKRSSELLDSDDFEDAMFYLKSGMAEASDELEKYFNRVS